MFYFIGDKDCDCWQSLYLIISTLLRQPRETQHEYTTLYDKRYDDRNVILCPN